MKLRPLLLAALTIAAALIPATGAMAFRGNNFQSPTGNIRCEYQGSQLFCSTSNDSFGVVLPDSGPPVTARGTAAGGATLAYGSVWSLGAFSCQSLTNGLSCENSSGNGFFLSRESYNSW